MKIAIKYAGLLLEADGTVAGHDAGATLVRRLLRVFPQAELVAPRIHRYKDFDVLPIEMVDGDTTVVINMDVIDSTSVWLALKENTERPKLMNFMWWNWTRYHSDVELATLSLAVALFPTFANSERTANALHNYVRRWTVPPLAERTRISWANLGIRLDHLQQRHEPERPTVLYPAIYMSERKQPQLFIDIVSKVARKVPIKVVARLTEQHLVSPQAMALSRNKWAWVGPLAPHRQQYWEALSQTTAFLATAREETYGLEYIEALLAGAVGVLPDKDWARAIVPPNYPFFYRTAAEAETMLLRAVTETAACRAQMDAAAGGSLVDWLKSYHNDDAFEASIAEHVERWFGPKAA
jgi:protoheme ferro-lyase